ncbi:MAG: restriction endonuclease subunit S [Oceanobacter sp.]
MTMEKELPEGWDLEELGALCSKIGSGSTPKGGQNAYVPVGVPLIRSMNIHFDLFKEDGLAFINDEAASKLNGVEVFRGDVLLNITGASIGRVNIVPEKYIGARVNQHVAIVRAFTGVKSRYIWYFLRTPALQNIIKETESGATRQALTKDKISSFKIPLPPLAEQQVIADKLDALLAQVETTKTRLERVPETIKRFRQSVLAAAVSGRLTEEWREEATTQQWETVKLEAVSDIKDPHPSHRTPKVVEGGVPYIGIGDLLENGEIDFANARKVDRSVLEEHNSRYQLQNGDFVFGKIGTLGKVTVLPIGIDYTLSANVILIQPIKSKVIPKYLMMFLSAPGTMAEVAKQANSTSQAAFGIKKMRALVTDIPPLPEQQEIVRRVEELFAHADAVEQQAKAALEKVNNLTQSILAKAFRGELTADWRAANPELISGENSAEALLARIKEERAAQKPKKRATTRRKKKVVSD